MLLLLRCVEGTITKAVTIPIEAEVEEAVRVVVVVTAILVLLRVANRHTSHDVVHNSDNDNDDGNDDVDVPWLVSILIFLVMDIADSDSSLVLLPLSPFRRLYLVLALK